MEDFLAESKGILIFLAILFGFFFIFVARPHQLDSLLSFATPDRDRVVLAIEGFERINRSETPSDNLKRIAKKFSEWSGLPYEDAEKLSTTVATEYHGGLVLATVVASELHIPGPGTRYLIFSEYDWPSEPFVVVDYEPDPVGTIFYTPAPVFVEHQDPRMMQFATQYANRIFVAWAEMRKPGLADRALIKKAKKFWEERQAESKGLPSAF